MLTFIEEERGDTNLLYSLEPALKETVFLFLSGLSYNLPTLFTILSFRK
jgi:hypothetical protein